MNCQFRRTCKKYNTDECGVMCFPYILLHGQSGVGGYWSKTHVPQKYSNCLKENLPIESSNPKVYKAVMDYIDTILEKVQEKNRGIYFCGGTGTGKTTIAITIMNEYLIARCRQNLRGEKEIIYNPALFMRLSEFQNLYNAQFRGSTEMINESSARFYEFKGAMKLVDLLVIDDIALRGCTDAFQNELYKIIDFRATEDRTTFFTSNEDYSKLREVVGERITSKIMGMCGNPIILKGKDHRTEIFD